MDRVQHAETPHGRGRPTMLDTDTTYGMTPRPSAFGDLRFAGTIAAGLVAGTLGLGALAAPLVGWRDWPAALGNDTSSETLTLAPALKDKPSRHQGPKTHGAKPTPGGAAPILVGLPGGGSAPGTGAGLAAIINAGGAGGTGIGVPGSSAPANTVKSHKNTTFDSTENAEARPARTVATH